MVVPVLRRARELQQRLARPGHAYDKALRPSLRHAPYILDRLLRRQQLPRPAGMLHGQVGTDPAFTEPAVSATLTLKASGTLYGLSFCNIHGLWESSKAVKVG